MKTAQYFTIEGEIKEVSPEDGKQFTYKELQALVGDMIEIVPLPSGKLLVCHEEGKLINLPKNENATNVWKAEYPIELYPDNNDELIVGNILITPANLIE